MAATNRRSATKAPQAPAANSRRRPQSTTEREDGDPEFGFPRPGVVLKRLRSQRGLTLREIGQASGLSPSFLAALERGETDIALDRLARLARVFDHDVGSFLGFSPRHAQPYFLGPDERITVDRGPGIEYRVMRVPGMGFEVILTDLPPHTGFRDELSHEGVDTTLVTAGRIVATYNHVDYTLDTEACVTWSGGYPHAFRNDSDQHAQYVGIVTAMLF